MVTLSDVDDFARFAGEQLQRGQVASMADLAAAWEEARQLQADIKAIRESEKDHAAGRTKSVEEAFASVRSKLGWNQ